MRYWFGFVQKYLFLQTFIFYNEIKIVFQLQVTIIVDEIVNASFQCRPHVCDQAEIKSSADQHTFRGFALFVGTKFFEYPAIAAKLIVNVPDDVVTVGIEPVVEAVPAHICAKFLVNPPG
jgi:hypothetical protein